MTETEEKIESSSLPKEEKKIKKEGTPSWLYKWMVAIESGNFSNVNFRRKHKKLGNKISNIEIRLRKIEKTMEHIKYLSSDDLKGSFKKKVLNDIDRDWEEILNNL